MENNTNFTSLEILKMAKELVTNEHIDRRAEIHNRWLVESDFLWRSRKLRLAYPSIPPYPTEVEIVLRAQKLMDFLNLYANRNTKEDNIVPQVEPAVLETANIELASPALPESGNVEITNESIGPSVDPVDEKPAIMSGNLLSSASEETLSTKLSMFQHFENIKNAWKTQGTKDQ